MYNGVHCRILFLPSRHFLVRLNVELSFTNLAFCADKILQPKKWQEKPLLQLLEIAASPLFLRVAYVCKPLSFKEEN